MRNFIGVMLIIGVSIFLSGCIETRQEFTLNPDGSGKVIAEAIFQPIDIDLSEEAEEKDPEVQMKDAVRETLEESSGVDVWKDVAFERTDDGRISFKGTAYFKDLSKLKLKFGGVDMKMMNPVFTKDTKGGMVLELKDEKEKKTKVSKKEALELSEEEITKEIKKEKAKYGQLKPMMTSFLSTMKMEMTYRLPGTLKEVSNFKRDKKGVVRITFEGARLLEIMDKWTADDAWWREQMLAGRDVSKDGPPGLAMNEELFGEKGPIRATVTGNLKTLFDYEAEVAAARTNYPKLLKELGAVAAIPVAPAAGEGFKSLKVGGVRIVSVSDQKRDVRPFHQGAGYTLSLVGELPGAVLEVSGGKLEKATADNGDSLLPKREWDRKVHFPRLSKDKAMVVFEVKLDLPGENVKALREISGVLEYSVAGGSREVDLGITEFTADAKGKEFGAVIESVKESEWEEGSEMLALKLNLLSGSVKSAVFYDESGKKLDISSSGYSGFGNTTTFNYRCKGKFPARGRVVVEVFEDLKKYEIPFKIQNISLMGQPRN